MERLGTADEVARTMVFLADEASGYHRSGAGCQRRAGDLMRAEYREGERFSRLEYKAETFYDCDFSDCTFIDCTFENCKAGSQRAE